MQKTKTIHGKKYTAKQIINLKHVKTNGGDYRTIEKIDVVWNYRQCQDQFWAPVCNPQNANSIKIEIMTMQPGNNEVWLSL